MKRRIYDEILEWKKYNGTTELFAKENYKSYILILISYPKAFYILHMSFMPEIIEKKCTNIYDSSNINQKNVKIIVDISHFSENK